MRGRMKVLFSQIIPQTLFLFLFGLSFGCVQWVPIIEAQETNQPPRIIKVTPTPTNEVVTISPTDPISLKAFTIERVSDPDKQDSLRVHWFLNNAYLNQEIISPTNSVDRVVSVSREIRLSELVQGQVNIIEVVISDREEPGAFERNFENGLQDSYRWFIDYSN